MTSAPSPLHPDPMFVPVDRRVLGLDRRSLLPAAVVLGLALFLGWLLPVVDGAVALDDEIRPGDRLAVGDGLVVTPPVGWQLQTGVRLAPGASAASGAPARLVSDGATITILSASFSGSPDDLLERANEIEGATGTRPEFTVAGGRSTLTTSGGLAGVVEDWDGLSSEGVLAAVTAASDGEDDVGVTITVDAPRGQLAGIVDEVNALIDSLGSEQGS